MKKRNRNKNNEASTKEGQSTIFPQEKELLQIREFIRNIYNRIEKVEKENKSLEEKVFFWEKKIKEILGNEIICPQEEKEQEETVQLGELILMDVESKEEKPEGELTEEQHKEQETSSDWLFFSTPENGCFKISSQKRNGDTNVCYKINTKTLDIEFIHSMFDSRLLSYRNEYLLPICDLVNNVASAASIKMEKPGKVIKQGEGYVIVPNNKIKIKLL